MKRVLICVLILATNVFAQTDYTKYVNPFIGTGGHGHTFPGATMPFGMVQLSPDTRVDNWDGSSGYHYSDSIIYGFSHTHLSGTGIPDYCDILLAPTIGAKYAAKEGEKDVNGYASKFSHENEKAEPGYYSVKLDDDGIFAELTATPRVGFHRYTFPQTDDARITLDLKWRDKVLNTELVVVGNNRIEGFRRSESWAKNQVVYFVAEFSQRFSDVTSQGLVSVIKFGNPNNEPILVKVAISPVSVEGARKNLTAEIPHWNFDKVRADAKIAWNKELSQIEVAGGTEAQMTNFYSALYHTKIQPNLYEDVDGNYLGVDKKIHNINDDEPKDRKSNYTVFSLWDTFRAAHPLYTITDRKRTADFINTFIRQYEQGGRLPLWELSANETDTMIGYHAVSVIADAMAKGIEGFDYKKAFEAAKHSAELDHFGLAGYKKRGYVSMEDDNESVSKTLEYAYNDFCIAQMARILYEKERTAWVKGGSLIPRSAVAKPGEKQRKYIPPFERYEYDFKEYSARAQYYKNLFDRQTGFMRPKQNGNWISPFLPNEVNFHFTEGNSWVYTFFVPHDVNGLIGLMGGKEKFSAKLDELFTTEDKLTGREQPDITGLIGQYAHGNEPSHHIAYLYNYAGEPWKTQKLIRRILDEFYMPTPDGLIGNEDCGQMSAWYIMSALGFYQVAPSNPNYDLGTPLFRTAKIKLENGKTLTISAKNASPANLYVKSVRLNGKPLKRTSFSHIDIQNGGSLEFQMTDAPVKMWFTEFSTSENVSDFPTVPTIEAQRVFKESTTVKITTPDDDSQIFYTTDGSAPDENSPVYKAPFTVDKSTTIHAISVDKEGRTSLAADAKINRIPHDWTVKIEGKYNRQYTGGGDIGLIDGIRGTINFASGEWQGYQPQDFVAVVDLQRETEIKKVGGGFLQIARTWIWMPTRIEFEVSSDGTSFRKVAEIITDVKPEDMTPTIRDYVKSIEPTKARFVRVKAFNLGKIPAWHPGAGYDAFVFVDEIFID